MGAVDHMLVKRIGKGGMGEVWRARDPVLNRVVAMKLLRPELLHRASLRARFLEEAQVTAQLEHPGIVPVYRLDHLPDGRPFYTMKEIEGHTLRDAIDEWGQRYVECVVEAMVGSPDDAAVQVINSMCNHSYNAY